MQWLVLGLGVLALAGLAYWELILVEGVHLGPRVVVWLYDLYARRYDQIKEWDDENEDAYVAGPVADWLAGMPTPLVADIASGTGRVPLALMRHPLFCNGRVIALDASRQMIQVAQERLAAWPGRVCFILGDATRLPFPNGRFDAVTCLEALEFFPDMPGTVHELYRIVRPGGALFITNRVGSQAHLFLGRAYSRRAFEDLLKSAGFDNVETSIWQVDYDAVTAYRPLETRSR